MKNTTLHSMCSLVTRTCERVCAMKRRKLHRDKPNLTSNLIKCADCINSSTFDISLISIDVCTILLKFDVQMKTPLNPFIHTASVPQLTPFGPFIAKLNSNGIFVC